MLNKFNLKNDRKEYQSNSVFIVDHQLKPNSNKSSLTYDILFKPPSRYSKKLDDFV